MSTHPSFTTYSTIIGQVETRPLADPTTTKNPYGFTLQLRRVSAGKASIYRAVAGVYAFSIAPFFSWVQSALSFGSGLGDPGFRHVVPHTLRHHLIVTTPPPGTAFPTSHPTDDRARVWLAPSNTSFAIKEFRRGRVEEVYVPHYPKHLVGSRKVKPGDLIFVRRRGYYLSSDIGRVPISADKAAGMVAMEGYTVDQQMAIIFIPFEYVKPPSFFAGIFSGEERDSEGEDGGDNERGGVS